METDQLLPVAQNRRKTKTRWGSTGSRFVLYSLIGVLAIVFGKRLAHSALNYKYYYDLTRSRVPEQTLHSTYLNALEENYAREWSLKYTSEPHLAGTNYGLAEWTKDKFEEYGFETDIKTYHVYLNFPNEHSLSLSENDKVIYEAPLTEDVLKDDPTTQGDDLIPTFHGYSANGNVTAEYIYANYGTKEDFDLLESLKVDITGKIVIVRYGKIYRGLKVKFAQEHGAVGVLIYSDPGDDGEFTPANGYKQYPYGPARQESSVQRGSVMYLSAIPGDPTTPGYASKPGVERADPHHSTPKIPSLPISYREVQPILEKLNGHGLSAGGIAEDWYGALPGFDYFVGPSAGHTLNLYNDQIYNITPIWNVFGEMKGLLSDEVILIGNHRDAWTKGGAADPNSGSSSVLEIMRGFSELKKIGWKPLRTIIFASWDAEEHGLVGSTEYAEDLAKYLQRNVVAYYNVDTSVSGSHLDMTASPVLNHILRETAKLIQHPKGGSLYDRFKEEKNDTINILGSGTDYTAFAQHLGIPSFDIGFSQSPEDPVYHYHSNYDSFHWMDTLTDPGFVYHNVLAKYLGMLILRMSEQEVIDFKVSEYGHEIAGYFNDSISSIPKEWLSKNIKKQLDFKDIDLEFLSKISKVFALIQKKALDKFWDLKRLLNKDDAHVSSHKPHKPHAPHKHKNEEIKFEDLIEKTIDSLNEFINITKEYDAYATKLQTAYESSGNMTVFSQISLLIKIKYSNLKMKFLERNFLHEEGLVGRPWFKHIIYAAGRYTGYGGQSLPGLREAIEDSDFEHAVEWITILWMAIRRASFILRL